MTLIIHSDPMLQEAFSSDHDRAAAQCAMPGEPCIASAVCCGDQFCKAYGSSPFGFCQQLFTAEAMMKEVRPPQNAAVQSSKISSPVRV